MAELNLGDLGIFGFTGNGVRVSSGDTKVRLNHNDGTFVQRIQTLIVGNDGKWQKARTNKGIEEVYVVQKGWIGHATIYLEKPLFEVFKAGSILRTTRGKPYNIFEAPGTTVIVVGFGEMDSKHSNSEKGGLDFWPSDELDTACQKMKADDLLDLLKKPEQNEKFQYD